MNKWKSSEENRRAYDNQEWHWPIDPTQYDRSGTLTDAEAREFAYLVSRPSGRTGHWSPRTHEILRRLWHPIQDVMKWTQANESAQWSVMRALVAEMDRRQQAYWGWTQAQWIETFQPSNYAFQAHFIAAEGGRAQLLAVAYLLCEFAGLYDIGMYDRLALARKVFGRERVDAVIQRVFDVLSGWGYRAPYIEHYLHRPVCEALLVNRSPRLEDLTIEFLVEMREHLPEHRRHELQTMSHGLHGLGILDRALPKATSTSDTQDPEAKRGVPEVWYSWCERWKNTSTIAPESRSRVFLLLLKAGRWLAQEHPEITEPSQWTRELAAEYVAVITRAKIGEWTESTRTHRARAGEPISPRAKAHHLSAMCSFFRDCQEWEWIPRRFDPRRCFATPRTLRALIGPNPRVLADDVWAKLLWAGLNLTEADLGVSNHGKQHFYPLEMVRAIAMVWLFAGLRVNEIERLRVGCIRWQSPTEGAPTPKARDGNVPRAVCFLDVPVNKTSTAFTKPVDYVVGEAIEAWEKLRPEQPPELDRKTAEVVDFLFAFRGRRINMPSYLNDTFIPLLCQKAGVQESDARGRITSHRARSTIASQLANTKDPMTLLELQAWLGHRHPASTLSYVTVKLAKMAGAYLDTRYFERNLRMVEVLLDLDAIKSGGAAGGEPWKFYDLGHGYCTYDFFDQCPHRMACAKCSFYVPKSSSKAELLESKANLQHMLQAIPLLEDERAAVEDGLGAIEGLLERLANVPTPAGPTPRELGQSRPELTIIPLQVDMSGAIHDTDTASASVQTANPVEPQAEANQHRPSEVPTNARASRPRAKSSAARRHN